MNDQEIRLQALRLACASPLVNTKFILARAESFARYIETGDIAPPAPTAEGGNPYDEAMDAAREGLSE